MLTSFMHTLSSSLQTPVFIVLIALVIIMLVVVGTIIAEFFTERRYFKLSLPALIDELGENPDTEAAINNSKMLWRQKKALAELLHHPKASPSARESLAENIVAKERGIYEKRVKVTDFIAKVSPMLGLMGTLIPLGPGIIAITEGEIDILSKSLLTAFDSTITGLVVAAVALLISTIRKTWYAHYMSSFTAATECVLEIANGDAPVYAAAAAEGELSGEEA